MAARGRSRGWGGRHGRLWFVLLWAVMPVAGAARGEASTAAGTVVVNTASASWQGGAAVSAPASFTVAQYAQVRVEPATGAAPGVAGAELAYPVRVINAGNGLDRFTLSVAGEAGWPAAVYRDDNGDGLRQANETAMVATTGPLGPGEGFACVLVVQAPPGASGSECTRLCATSVANPEAWAEGSYTSTVPAGPTAQFAATPTVGMAPLQVSFQDQSSGGPAAWAWVFGDGGTSSQQHPQHSYVSLGCYSVSLTVSSARGSDTAMRADFVAVGGSLEDDDPGIAYTGAWAQSTLAGSSAGHFTYSEARGATAEADFYGTGITWRSATGPTMGKALLYLDGVKTGGFVDLYSSTWGFTATTVSGLTRDRHTLKVAVSGKKSPSSQGVAVSVDLLTIAP